MTSSFTRSSRPRSLTEAPCRPQGGRDRFLRKSSSHEQARRSAYTDGYATWPRINKKPFSTPGAHNGVKNVYTSKQRGRNRLFPNGTVIVKSIVTPGEKGRPGQVAVMRKVNGRWRWIEYTLTGRRYGVLAQGALCSACHMQVKARDWVFTRAS